MNPPIDLTIHQLAELRGAILHCIDEGRLVKGKREPWSFYPLIAELQNVIIQIARCTCANAGRYGHYDNDACALSIARAALAKAADWHMDESGDCNDQRGDFCDDIMDVLLKRIKESQ